MSSDSKSIYKNLSKVFRFYSIQQSLLGRSPTFDSIGHNLSTLTRGKFLKFCLDFSLPLKQDEVLYLFNSISGFKQEIKFSEFLQLLEQIRGERPKEEFYKFIGAYNSRECLAKCKPFSKRNGSSLPELPPLISAKRHLNSNFSTKNAGSAGNVSKSLFEQGKSKIVSSLPAAAIAIPRFNSRNGSYHCRYGKSKEKFRNWDEIDKIDTGRMVSIYGDLALQELIVKDERDDEVLEKYGY